jgi:ELWxxDGT repeat protein
MTGQRVNRRPPRSPALWQTDGSASGTKLLKDILPRANGSVPSGLFAAGGAVFFGALEASSGTELWRTNGVASDTVRIAETFGAGSMASPKGTHEV